MTRRSIRWFRWPCGRGRLAALSLPLAAGLVLAAGCARKPPPRRFVYPANLQQYRPLPTPPVYPTAPPFYRAAPPVNPATPTGSIREVRVHIMQPGEDLAGLLDRFHLTPGQLATLNPGLRLDQLKAGDRLVVHEEIRN